MLESSSSTALASASSPRVFVAGTFDRLHAGHAALLDAAIAAAARENGSLEVWVTSDAMAAAKADAARQTLRSAAARCADVAALCAARAAASTATAGVRASLHLLDDAVGPAATAADDAVLICSEETLPGAERINEVRAAARRAPLRLVVVGLLRGPDGAKLSSTALRQAAETMKKTDIEAAAAMRRPAAEVSQI